MKWILLYSFWMVVSQGYAQDSPAAVLKVLVQNEHDMFEALAIGDKTVWNKHMHDSCLIAIEDGSVLSKKAFLEDMNPLPKGFIGRIHVIEPRIQLHGNTAVLSFIDDEYLELYGQNIHTQYRQSDTWIKTGETWKLISFQLFEIPKNPGPIEVDTEILNRYTGVYSLAPERICSVYVDKGSLFAKKGTRDPQQLFAETETMFFMKGDGRINVIFRRNVSGKYEMIERREGEDVVWRLLYR